MRHARWRRRTPRRSGAVGRRWRCGNVSGSNGVNDADDSLPPGGSTIQRALEALVTLFNERGIRYAIIGGIATIQHTRIRTTDDIDALLAVPQVEMPGLFQAMIDRGFELDVVKTIREFRDDGLASIHFGQVIVDLMRPVLPVYARVLDRAITTQILGQSVQVSSAEGLILMKLIAMRPQDESDIQDLLSAYAGQLDLAFVRHELDSIFPADDPRRMKFEQWARDIATNESA
jgi:predicted nucleotidyltransferase